MTRAFLALATGLCLLASTSAFAYPKGTKAVIDGEVVRKGPKGGYHQGKKGSVMPAKVWNERALPDSWHTIKPLRPAR